MNSPAPVRRRLLVLSSTWPAGRDGAGPAFVRELCLGLAAHFELRVLVPHGPGLALREQDDGFEVWRYRYAPARLEQLAYGAGIAGQLKAATWRWLLVPGFLLAQILAIRRQSREFRPQLVHAHWLVPQAVAASCAGLEVPLACTCHGTDVFGFNGRLGALLKRYAVRRCQAISVVSGALASALAGRLPQAPRSTVLPMGVDLRARFTPQPSHPRQPYRLLFVGRLVEVKGVRVLLQALPAILRQCPQATLDVVGDGPLRGELEQLAHSLGVSPQVRFLGRRASSELPALYRSAAACVVPSVRTGDGHEEALGLVMVEALGCGCPLAASDLPGMADVLRDGHTGLAFAGGDAQALAGAVVRLLGDPVLAGRLAQAGREEVLARFDWQVVSRRYAAWLAAL